LVESRAARKLLDLRVIRTIKVKIEFASNEELTRSGGRKINKSIKLAEKMREMHILACFSGGRRRTV